jgi:glutamate synthase (NADPH) small chain
MELGEPDASGRRRPVPEAGSEFDFEADMVVYAIGTNANPIIGQTSKLQLNKRGYLATDEEPRHLDSRRVRRRRHRHRRRDGDRGDGRGPRAARGMKAYLGLRDSVYEGATASA